MTTKWNDLKEVKPKMSNGSDVYPYLVTDGMDEYVAWTSDGDVWKYSHCCGCYELNITHWMELPEIPK